MIKSIQKQLAETPPWEYETPEDRALGLACQLLVWNPAWKARPEGFYRFVQGLRDVLRAEKGRWLWRSTAARPHLYKVYDGRMDDEQEDAFRTVTHLHGQAGSVALRDPHFFHGPDAALRNPIARNPTLFSVKDLDAFATEDRIWEQSMKGALDLARQSLPDLAERGGGDLSGLLPEVPLPVGNDAWMDYLNAPLQTEAELYDRLAEMNRRYPLKDVELQMFYHRLVVNAECALADVRGSQVVPVAYDPRQTSVLAAGPIRSFEEADAVACFDTLTLTRLLSEYPYLSERSGYKGLLRDLQELIDFGETALHARYDPARLYLDSPEALARSEAGDVPGGQVFGWASWANGFYGYESGQPVVSRQRMWWRMLMPHRYRLLLDGKNPTKETLRAWDYGTDPDRRPTATFQRVEKDYEAREAETVRNGVFPQTWQATCVGPHLLLDCGPYVDALPHPDPARPSFPLVGLAAPERSLGVLGEYFAYMKAIVMLKVTTVMNLASAADAAILVDEAQLPDGMDPQALLHNLQQAGFGVYNSKMLKSGADRLTEKHLQVIRIGVADNAISKWLLADAALTQAFNNLIGLTPAMYGQTRASDGLGEMQLSLANASAMTARWYYDHNRAVGELLQRCVERGIRVWPDEPSPYDRGRASGSVMRQLRARWRKAVPRVFVDNSAEAAEKKRFVTSLFDKVLSGNGDADMLGRMLEFYYDEGNPAKGIGIFRQTSAEIKEMSQQMQAMQQQMSQAEAQRRDRETQIPLLVEQMRSQTTLEKEHLKTEREAAKQQQRAESEDISAVNRREEAALETMLTAPPPPQ